MRRLAFVAALFALACIQAANAEAPLFASHTPIEVTIAGPWNELDGRDDDRTQHPFTLQANGREHAIKIRPRGHSRRRVCTFPPLRLNFDTDATAGSVFEGQDKLKLVSQCRKGRRSELDLLEEYAAYRFFGLLSDAAYAVRLLRVTYVEPGRARDKPVTRVAFVIESNEALAARLGAAEAELPALALSQLEHTQAARMYVFQYLIGNTDWSFVTADHANACCHNGRLLRRNDRLLYIPYDFDLSGLVNARYARPDASLRLRGVTERRWRGFCMAREPLAVALEEVRERRQALFAVLDELPVTKAKDLTRARRFVERFFEETDDQDAFFAMIDRRCLGAGS